MDKDENIEKLILDYIDGRLSASDQEVVKRHISNNEKYKQLEEEYRILFDFMEQDNLVVPSTKLRDAFQTMLIQVESDSYKAKEEKKNNAENIGIRLTTNSSRFLKVAATVSLILGSFLFGLNRNTAKYEDQLVQMKQEVALLLMESNSPSKRIQAVMYSEELDEANTEILDALIHMMNNDHHINVRLAAATRLLQQQVLH